MEHKLFFGNGSRWMHLGLLLLGLVVLLASCGGEKDDKKLVKDVWTEPGVYDAEPEVDIEGYFDSLVDSCGAQVWTHCEDWGETDSVWKGVRELDRYVKHQRQYYPADEVRLALDFLAFQQGYLWSHAGIEEKVNAGEVFLYRLLEQAAFHSPHLDYITDFHAVDGKAGILNYQEWSPNPLYSFLIYQTEQGYKVMKIGESGDVRIDKIFPLQDQQGRTYYLCSNNNLGLFFRQYLYGWDGETMQFLCKATSSDCIEEQLSFPVDYYDDKYTLIFNPRRIEWNR